MKASGGGFSDIEGKQLEYPMVYDRCVEINVILLSVFAGCVLGCLLSR